MKRKSHFLAFLMVIFFGLGAIKSYGQCSICTRTVQQMGDKPGKAFNIGIVYLAVTPLAIGGIVGYKWYKHNR